MNTTIKCHNHRPQTNTQHCKEKTDHRHTQKIKVKHSASLHQQIDRHKNTPSQEPNTKSPSPIGATTMNKQQQQQQPKQNCRLKKDSPRATRGLNIFHRPHFCPRNLQTRIQKQINEATYINKRIQLKQTPTFSDIEMIGIL